MKNIFLPSIMVLSILMFQCKHDNVTGNNEREGNDNGVRIRGTISGLKKTNGGASLANAKKVLVFSKYYYSLSDIKADTFSVTGRAGTGIALIFLDADNKYIGNLSAHGMNMLPLGNLADGENTSIDLSTLTLVGTSVIPTHDPFGNEILISEEELQSLKVIDSYYESIAKNIDANNDGIPDVLSDKQLVISTNFTIYGGHWGHNDTIPAVTDSSNYYVNYGLEIGGGSALTFYAGNISLKGPSDDPYSDIVLWGFMKAPACGGNRGFIASFARLENAPMGAPWGSAFLPFKKGTYTLSLDFDPSYTLDYSSVNMQNNLVLIVPTLHTDSLGRLISITFRYTLPNGTVINPASMLTNVMVQLSDKYGHQFYVNDKGKLTAKTGFTSLSMEKPVDISTLAGMNIGYDDLLGNQYMIVWN